ncbi:hypothetical protein M9H77_02113 [Catharanthus roseus]|uniref:Uncharacterized protein n=1 Tax=Catharanthus roseus TaxID=4058 RepID=A0ACC0C7J4_CATRO|nr:hypothetical protein M9H77_02113 [Catharanthus roseus]
MGGTSINYVFTITVMLRLQDLQRSSYNRLNNSGRVTCRHVQYATVGSRRDDSDQVWTCEVLHFGVETTNRAESQHSVLKIWLSTCHGDLDTVFLNVDSVIESQIAEIKSSLENSKLKEKFKARSNPILKNLSDRISHWALKKIWDEIKRARELSDDAQNKCGHYIRKSHGLPCACELLSRTGPITKVRECRRLMKGILCSVLPQDPCAPLTSPPEHAVTKGRRKTKSTKRDKSYWEHMSIAHRKIGKSSGPGSGSGSGSSSGSSSNSRGRGRPPRVPRGRGRGRSSRRSSLSYVLHLWDGCPLPHLNVQWEFHCDIQLSGWEEPYSLRVSDWVRQQHPLVLPRDPIIVEAD